MRVRIHTWWSLHVRDDGFECLALCSSHDTGVRGSYLEASPLELLVPLGVFVRDLAIVVHGGGLELEESSAVNGWGKRR